MGDHFQTIVDIDATAAQAPDLAASVVAWLVGRGIVVAGTSDCALDGAGHAPGPNHADAVAEPTPRLHTLRCNGMAVIIERTVFCSGEASQVGCPHCDTIIELLDEGGVPAAAWQPLADAIGAWHADGVDGYSCPGCGRPAGLNEWRWSPPWGFGYLGLTFWNWPLLAGEFVAGLSRRLGHRTVRTYGKL